MHTGSDFINYVRNNLALVSRSHLIVYVDFPTAIKVSQKTCFDKLENYVTIRHDARWKFSELTQFVKLHFGAIFGMFSTIYLMCLGLNSCLC